MKAMYYENFGVVPTIETVPDPTPKPHGAVVRVLTSGICRSDWHGWMGHDADIKLPHVPGHELVGEIVELGKEITRFTIGDRVTVPFVSGCGHCRPCQGGNHQVCDHQFQPGFTAWGSFAEYVSLDYADINLVLLPENIKSVTAASLGCRFITSFRAVVDQGKVQGGDWVAIHGCGGVGLSAIMIANALGANVIAVDISDKTLDLARRLGAKYLINATKTDVVAAIKSESGGGVDVSIDALGSKQTCSNSITCLKKQGKHIQVGLLLGKDYLPELPMHLVIANELEIIGSHGMQAFRYPAIFKMMEKGLLRPELLVNKIVSLEEGILELTHMDAFDRQGVPVINRFS